MTHDITEEAGIDNVNVLLLGEIGKFSRNGFVLLKLGASLQVLGRVLGIEVGR